MVGEQPAGAERKGACFGVCAFILVLCALTDVGRGVYMSSYHTPWTWLLPLLVLLFVGLGYWLRGLFRVQLNQEGSIWGLVNSNLTILLVLCVLTVCVGNTNRGYHHELEAEHYLRAQEYDKVLQVGNIRWRPVVR